MPTYTILQRYRCRGNKTWYGRINDGGVIKYMSLKTKRKADAQAWLDAKNAARFFPELAVKTERKELAMANVLNAYVDQKEKTLHNDGSVSRYQNVAKITMRYMEALGFFGLLDWNRKRAQDFVLWLSERYNENTTGQIVSIVSQIFKWAVAQYDLDCRNPFEGIDKPKVPKRVKEFWTPEQIDAILDHAPTPAARLEWAFMAFAGLRRHEAYKVKQEDIMDGNLHIIGKGNKEAFVPISERLQAEIDRAGGVIHDATCVKDKFNVLARTVKACGIPGRANPHKFRHSFVSNLIRAHVDAKAVQVLARHENITTTLSIYAHLLQDDLSDAVNKIK